MSPRYKEDWGECCTRCTLLSLKGQGGLEQWREVWTQCLREQARGLGRQGAGCSYH